jgi:orotidine-5'-phosphate decarboxylase
MAMTAVDTEVPETAMQQKTTPKLEIPPKERLIVALDVDTKDEASKVIALLDDTVEFYKVGLQLWAGGGYRDVIVELSKRKKKIFADLKFHDIPNTVQSAMRNLQQFNPTFVSFFAQETAAIKAACAERKNGTRVLAVTVLTSLNQDDLEAQGIDISIEDLVLRNARAALKAGADGVIASGHEVEILREEFSDRSDRVVIVVPGIRGYKGDPERPTDDQKRTVPVEEAIEKGADYVVVGRPIREAENPKTAALEFQARIAEALS